MSKAFVVTAAGILLTAGASCQKRQGEPGRSPATNPPAQKQEPPAVAVQTNSTPKNRMEGRTAAELFQEGLKFLDGKGVTKDPAEAVKYFQAAADRGDADAQAYLGAAFRTGTGIAKDAAMAARYFQAAAEKGDARSQGVLASMLATGEGVPKNLPESAKWYRLAAEQGLVRAQANLGAMYYLGQGVAKNDVEAYKWLHLAALKGD
ncbi:MAG: sel1 repeat family protein, partial [Verrucomicrobia bacterium]|nr:sel1 repeat family protein [Verrucomicrobiota bacterium]